MLLTSSWVSDAFLFAILSILVIHVLRGLKSKTFFVFDPLIFFWAGVLVIYVNEGISNYENYVQRYGEESIEATYAWIFMGLLFLHFGYSLRQGSRLARKIPHLSTKISPNGMLFFSVAITALGLLGWSMQIQSAGSLTAWAATPRGGENWEELSGYVTQLSSMLIVGLSLLLLHVEMHRRSLFMKVVAWSLIGLLFLFFLYLGSRSRIIAVLLVALMAWSLPRRRNPSFLLLVPLGLVLFVLVSFQAEYRMHFRNFSFNLHEIDFTEVPSRILPRYISGDDSQKTFTLGTSFSMTAAVVDLVPKEIPFAMGGEFLQLVTHAIPRAIWPEKRYPRGELWSEVHLRAGTSNWWVTHISKPYLAGPAPGYIASWYYNGSVFGLFVGGVITGVFFRFVRGFYERGRANESYIVLYTVLAPVGFGEAVGHPFNWVYTMTLVLIPLTLILKFTGTSSKVRNRRRKYQIWTSP